MTREEIIAMAREVGLRNHIAFFSDSDVAVALHRFAAIIASRVATAAKAEEREACAKVCDDLTVTDGLHQAKYCANAIRARGETK